jgi:hypothetical protein
MKRLWIALMALGAVFVAASLAPSTAVQGSSPGSTAAPLLKACADLDGNGAVSGGDIGNIVLRFGRNNTTNPGTPPMSHYHLMYDVTNTVDGSISGGDIGKLVQHFGKNPGNTPGCKTDVQVARATLWGQGIAAPDIAGYSGTCNDFGSNPAPPLTINSTTEATLQNTNHYYRSSVDGPGQGVHYVNDANWSDNVFDPCKPEGLVYDNFPGKLVAQLYYMDGHTVGWGGPEPDPDGPRPNDVDLDPFCSPAPCSWDGPGDGWHVHFRLCTGNIGQSSAFAAPNTLDENCPDETDPGCGSGPVADCFRWEQVTGWMGHLFNHLGNVNQVDENGDTVPDNGRFADCFPDGLGWKAYNCPG